MGEERRGWKCISFLDFSGSSACSWSGESVKLYSSLMHSCWVTCLHYPGLLSSAEVSSPLTQSSPPQPGARSTGLKMAGIRFLRDTLPLPASSWSGVGTWEMEERRRTGHLAWGRISISGWFQSVGTVPLKDDMVTWQILLKSLKSPDLCCTGKLNWRL